MTKDWNWHVESLKSRLSELTETVDTIRAAVEDRPGLKDATQAISSLISSAESIDQGLSKFPMVVSEILENSVLGAVLIGPAGKFLLHNQTAGEILGYSFILNRSDETLLFEDESGNQLDAHDLPWNRALEGDPVDDHRLNIKSDMHDQGKWITFAATPFTNNDGSVGGVMLFMLDTTEEVGIEESIESICSTISDQIAEVGSTQDQLQELADKLSKTGVQRLLSDRQDERADSSQQMEQSRPKKSIARHSEEVEANFNVASTQESSYSDSVVDHSSPESYSDSTEFDSQPEVDTSVSEEAEAVESDLDFEAEDNEVDFESLEESQVVDHESEQEEYQDQALEEEAEQEDHQEEVNEEDSDHEAVVEEAFEDEEEETAQVNEDSPQEEEGERESLFGKMAQLATGKDSTYQEPSDEMEPNLPWPEVVDSEDYGQNLWEEYTQTDETTSSSWEEDEGSEISNEPIEESEESEESDLFDLEEEESEYEGHDEQEEEEEDSDEEEEYDENESIEEMDDPGIYQEDDEEDDESSIETSYEVLAEGTNQFEEDSEAVQEEEELEESTIEAQYHEVDESNPEEISESEADVEESHREEVKGGKSLRNTLFGKKKKEDRKRRQKRPSGTYAAIGGPNELDASYLTDEQDSGESLLVNYSTTEEVEEKPVSNKILVVDDIPVNQKLLLLHLKRLGYEADVANNGKEALEAMEKEEYQVILMDCDMPVMNGFEAATKIRATEAYSHRRVPIIALTSYDREGDRDKCLAAGMDDYITKGSSRKELKDAIDRSIVSAKEKSQNTNVASEDDEFEADIEPLDINSMLKLYGKEEVEEISRLFLSNMAAYIECMQLAIDEKDADSVVHFSNAVKGPCAALGMKLMTKLTSNIIEIAEKGDWTQVRVKYMRLKAVFVQTQDELKKVCPDDSLMAK